MMKWKQFSLLFSVSIISLLAIFSNDQVDVSDPKKAFEEASNQEKKRNYKNAFEIYEKLLVESSFEDNNQAYVKAIACLLRLNKSHEVDAFSEKVLKQNSENPLVRIAITKSYFTAGSYGYLVDNQFYRGHSYRAGGVYTSSLSRDRVVAMQILEETKPLLGDNKSTIGAYHLAYAEVLLYGREHNNAWALQGLTDMVNLPEYDVSHYGLQGQNAAVDKNGKPIVYNIPSSYAAAENDGQRWRFHLEAAKIADPDLAGFVDYTFANFLMAQWGVSTLGYDWASQFDDKKEKSKYALQSLSDDEALCKLATGVSRFTFPEGFNYIKIFESLANSSTGGFEQSALDALGSIYENRRQFVKAAVVWESALKKGWNNAYYKQKVDQIRNNWGHFENIQPQLSDENASVQFRFRNASKVYFEAYKIDMPKLLSDLITKIKANNKLNWNELNISNLGFDLVNSNQSKYASEKYKNWEETLSPRPNHFDDLVALKIPFSESGAYLLKSKVENGNENFLVIFLTDTMLIQKQLDNQKLVYLADAKTGHPLPQMNVEFFGYHYEYKNKLRSVQTEQFALYTNENGMILSNKLFANSNLRWLMIARNEKGRFAYSGFQNYWHQAYYEQKYHGRKVFGITDRPVYKPQQVVHYKFWDRVVGYDDDHNAVSSPRNLRVEVYTPKGELLTSESFTTDNFGGINGSFLLPKDATLGQYTLMAYDDRYQINSIQIRVEEYKKPEFEVNILMPEKALKLGESFKAKIEAKYYFGAPVTKAKVKYKVLRTEHEFNWFPIRTWDWLYGNGYGWLSYDCEWYPGWRNWGCKRPYYWWFYRPAPQPEMVMENEVAIGEDGFVEIKIETGLFKELYGDKNHKFQIIAEVVDSSRRTIVGQGDIIVTSKPFKVFSWLDRSYYNEGDIINASFQARTASGSSVSGAGKVSLYEIKYNKDFEASEKKIHSEKLETDVAGYATYKFNAPKSGQYRLSFELKSEDGDKEEGAVLFNVYGDALEKNEVRFNDLELLAKKGEYQPGEIINLKINTNTKNSTVLLFLRPENSVYKEPEILKLENKSLSKNILVETKDMPNFFIEALTIRDGKLHVVTKEIIVPPEKKVLNVKLLPDQTSYKPGQESVVKVQVTDSKNKPYQGSLVLSVYDKAIEYISGGSNVLNIKEFFWKWRKQHRPYTESNFDQWFSCVYKNNADAMNSIGVFGHALIAETKESEISLERREVEKSKKDLGGSFIKNEVAKSVSDKLSSVPQSSNDSSGSLEKNLKTPAIRKDFADLAYWNGNILTDKNGLAQVSFKMPENLGAWKINSWAMGSKAEVGFESTEVVTTKDLLIRLQAPRFFVEKDEVVLSGIVHNYLKEKQKIKVVFEQFGDCVSDPENKEVWVEIPAKGEERVNWRVKVLHPGEVKIRMSALNDKESDAMEMKFPVLVHGMMKMDSFSGVIRPENESGAIQFTVPEQRKAEASELVINYSPTLAGAMVDALPYLVQYPYGCTEQTLNRFIPTVITQQILLKMNLNLEDIKNKKVNLNAAELGDATERAKDWKHWKANPVFDENQVKAMTNEGLSRLYSMQNANGGWGWFYDSDHEYSYPHTTATVVHGMFLAKSGGFAVSASSLDGGIDWLKKYQSKRLAKIQAKNLNADNSDALVYKVLAEFGFEEPLMRKFLMRDKSSLSVYSLCLMGMGFYALNHAAELKEVMENIDQYLEQDDENQTAWLRVDSGYWWYWYGSGIESNALYLQLLSKISPKEEKASRLVKYLLNNRKHATYWSSTRDTALCIEAIAAYWLASGETDPSMTIEIWIDDKKKNTVEINKENLFDFDNSFRLSGEAVTGGKHKIELRKKGKGPLYYNAYVSYFSKEDFIPKAGLELKATRTIYRLIKDDSGQIAPDKTGAVVKQNADKVKRVLLESNAVVTSGELLEIEITIDSKNEYEYICIEDPKAAGVETVDVRSGYNGNALGAYIEYKNTEVVMFAQRIGHGKFSVSYKVRAEIPGKFSALPTKIYAMYAPELKGNSDENKLEIIDRKD